MLLAGAAWAGPAAQPPGVNLTFGDVTHGKRAQSATTNPAAAAANLARAGDRKGKSAVVSVAGGIEYGNIQELWDYYDRISQAYKPSDPGEGGGPGQDPGDKPDDGIDLGDIWDLLDPDIQDEINAITREVATQTAILALISVEGYGKAWLGVDAPFVFPDNRWGGAWSMGLQWSGTARAFGFVQPIEYDEDQARQDIQDWFDTEINNRPVQLDVGGQVRLVVDAIGGVQFALQNDSSIATKASQLGTLSMGYSKAALSNESGALYLGAKANLHFMQLSRLSVRFGDITDSEELFEEIINADFESDTRVGLDIGALWVADNYQLGAQLTSINEPDFRFPDLDLTAYRDAAIIRSLERDTIYTMRSQLKLEGSVFTDDRRWSGHIGVDANSIVDPVGDEFQWLTLAAGYNTDSVWVPSFRFGLRRNLAGTELTYASLGLTGFKVVNFDISSALDSVSIDGRDLPQGLMLSVGFEIAW